VYVTIVSRCSTVTCAFPPSAASHPGHGRGGARVLADIGPRAGIFPGPTYRHAGPVGQIPRARRRADTAAVRPHDVHPPVTSSVALAGRRLQAVRADVFPRGRPSTRTLDARGLDDVTVVARAAPTTRASTSPTSSARSMPPGRARAVAGAHHSRGEEEHGSPTSTPSRAHRHRAGRHVLIGSTGPSRRTRPRSSWACAASSASRSSPTTASGLAALGQLRQHRAQPVLPLPAQRTSRSGRRAFGESHDAFRREATEMSPVGGAGGLETVPAPDGEHSPLHERRRSPRRGARSSPAPPTGAWTSASPPTRHRRRWRDRDARSWPTTADRTPGIAFTVRFASQPASYTSPTAGVRLAPAPARSSTATPSRWRSPPGRDAAAVGVHGHARHPRRCGSRPTATTSNHDATNTTCCATSSSRTALYRGRGRLEAA